MNHVEFMERFKDFAEVDRYAIELAYILSKDAHRSQARKTGERYFEHPRRVALILVDELAIRDCDLVCAALLHDIVEDTKYVTVPFIKHYFGPHCAGIVDRLTKRPGQDKDRYWAAFGEMELTDPLLVKCADRLDNLRSLPGTDELFRRKQTKETREKLLPAIERRIEAGGWKWHFELLRDLITAEVVKVEAMVDECQVIT